MKKIICALFILGNHLVASDMSVTNAPEKVALKSIVSILQWDKALSVLVTKSPEIFSSDVTQIREMLQEIKCKLPLQEKHYLLVDMFVTSRYKDLLSLLETAADASSISSELYSDLHDWTGHVFYVLYKNHQLSDTHTEIMKNIMTDLKKQSI